MTSFVRKEVHGRGMIAFQGNEVYFDKQARQGWIELLAGQLELHTVRFRLERLG